ncbi:MAG: hypothetical protein AAF636_05895 [Pseudomonadota bacterium]
MSNIISIGLPRRPNLTQRQTLALENFVSHRRTASDVYWLKENAELLNVLASSGARLPETALAPLAGFYAGLEERLRFFPQYYRFLLSMCLDLEDLGMPGQTGEALCDSVANSGAVEAELSDLQRAEARYLLSRRGFGTADPALDGRLDQFAHRSATFALPNKKAAYELTHLVFYRSDYGRRPIAADAALATSLEFAGLLAFLDQDVDLLAEVCVALRFAGVPPSDIWEDWLTGQLHSFVQEPAAPGSFHDAYHEFLVTSWWSLLRGDTGFTGIVKIGPMAIRRAVAPAGPLRAMSECMYHLGANRLCDWSRMRRFISDALGAEGHEILEGAERSSDRFDEFFQRFARAER